MQNTDTRIARPSVRNGWLNGRDRDRSGDATFIELPWDEALDILADELNRVRSTHGNKAIFAGSYGWASAGRFHHAQSQLRRFLNTIGGYTGAVNTYSHAGAEVLLPHIVGMSNRVFQDQMTSWPQIAQHAETLVAFGDISKRPAQIAAAGTSRHETQDWLDHATANGCAIVNISPLGSDLLSGAQGQWIAPRPGADCALILSLAYQVFVSGQADRAFLRRYTNGAEVFESYVMGKTDGIPKTPGWAAEICDVPEQEIRDLAQRIATTKTMINMSWSMQRAERGEITLWAGIALACILGQIGQPGTGFGFGYGSTEPVGRPDRWIDWPSLPQGHNPVSDFIPVARLADMLEKPAGRYTYNGENRQYPNAKLVWLAGGNPFHHHQDLGRLDRVWRNPETVIVMDHSWTATARRAYIVLPTTSPLGRDDLMINRRDAALVYMSPAIPLWAMHEMTTRSYQIWRCEWGHSQCLPKAAALLTGTVIFGINAKPLRRKRVLYCLTSTPSGIRGFSICPVRPRLGIYSRISSQTRMDTHCTRKAGVSKSKAWRLRRWKFQIAQTFQGGLAPSNGWAPPKLVNCISFPANLT